MEENSEQKKVLVSLIHTCISIEYQAIGCDRHHNVKRQFMSLIYNIIGPCCQLLSVVSWFSDMGQLGGTLYSFVRKGSKGCKGSLYRHELGL